MRNAVIVKSVLCFGLMGAAASSAQAATSGSCIDLNTNGVCESSDDPLTLNMFTTTTTPDGYVSRVLDVASNYRSYYPDLILGRSFDLGFADTVEITAPHITVLGNLKLRKVPGHTHRPTLTLRQDQFAYDDSIENAIQFGEKSKISADINLYMFTDQSVEFSPRSKVDLKTGVFGISSQGDVIIGERANIKAQEIFLGDDSRSGQDPVNSVFIKKGAILRAIPTASIDRQSYSTGKIHILADSSIEITGARIYGQEMLITGDSVYVNDKYTNSANERPYRTSFVGTWANGNPAVTYGWNGALGPESYGLTINAWGVPNMNKVSIAPSTLFNPSSFSAIMVDGVQLYP